VPVKLHAATVGRGPHVVLLHGLFGSGNSLGALARALSARFTVHSVDLPNHGRSDWLEGADLASMAACLQAWLLHHGIASAHCVGHSLGGKVAMQLALAHPECVMSLVVADIAPVTYPSHHDSVFAALDAVASGQCRSRGEASELMAPHLAEEAVIQFLLTSLQRGADGVYRWRFNLEGLKADYRAMREAPVPAGSYPGPVLFVKGGDSDYIRAEHRSHIVALFPAAQVKIMPGCGHWLHAERPAQFNGIVGRFLDAQSG
jgi:esterase